jgi:hypothetical protein
VREIERKESSGVEETGRDGQTVASSDSSSSVPSLSHHIQSRRWSIQIYMGSAVKRPRSRCLKERFGFLKNVCSDFWLKWVFLYYELGQFEL